MSGAAVENVRKRDDCRRRLTRGADHRLLHGGNSPEAWGSMVAGRFSEQDGDRLIDLIYDAAFDEALWPGVLEQLGDRAGGHPGNLLQLNIVDGHGFGITARTREDTLSRYFAQWAQLNPIGLPDDSFDYRRDWAPDHARPRIYRPAGAGAHSVLERVPGPDRGTPYDKSAAGAARRRPDGNRLRTTRAEWHVLGGRGRRALPVHRHLIRAKRI